MDSTEDERADEGATRRELEDVVLEAQRTVRRSAWATAGMVAFLLIALVAVRSVVIEYREYVEEVQESQRLDADDDRYLVKVERDRIDTMTTTTDGGGDRLNWGSTGENWSATARVIIDFEIVECAAAGLPVLNLLTDNDVEYMIQIAGEQQGQRVACEEDETYRHTFAGESFNLTELEIQIQHDDPDDGENRLTFTVHVHWIEIEWITEAEAVPFAGHAVLVLAAVAAAAVVAIRRQA